MQKIIAGVIVVLLVAGAVYLLMNRPQMPGGDGAGAGSGNEEIGTVTDPELGLTFSYRKGPNGYRVDTIPVRMSTEPDFINGYSLMLESDYEELQQATAPREGPPTLEVRAYKNTMKLRAPVWVERHPRESNAALIQGIPAEAIVGGANAVHYTSDGLYQTEVYAVAHGSYIFLFTGASNDPNAPHRADFDALIRSVAFIPENS